MRSVQWSLWLLPLSLGTEGDCCCLFVGGTLAESSIKRLSPEHRAAKAPGSLPASVLGSGGGSVGRGWDLEKLPGFCRTVCSGSNRQCPSPKHGVCPSSPLGMDTASYKLPTCLQQGWGATALGKGPCVQSLGAAFLCHSQIFTEGRRAGTDTHSCLSAPQNV